VYVWADVSGVWVTCVAGARYVFDGVTLPEPRRIDADGFDAWYQRSVEVGRLVESLPLEPIGGPHDGERFEDTTPGACADTLERLRGEGYHVPQYAIDDLRAEQSDGAR
jgi:hypothetical protein